jgi:putative ABC transport system permease protein
MERGEQILRELRYSLRTLRREPLFVLGVICTFALSIGTNAAMLGLVTRLMLSSPPGIRDPEQVARIQIERVAANGESFAMSSMSYPAFEALRGQKRAFSTVAAVRTDSVAIGRGSETSQAAALQATGDYFQLLGVIPALGRFYGPADDVLPLGNQVVVLGYAFWKSHFAGARNVLGRELIIDDQPFTIVGVAPRGFNGETLSSVELFMPLTAAMRNHDFGWWTNDRINLLSTIVRLAPGVNAGERARDFRPG